MRKLDNSIKQLLTNDNKRWAWIIYELSIQGRSLAAIARKAGVKRQTLYRARTLRYPRMQKVIADALDMQAKDLFPNRYDTNGLPVKLRGGAYCHDSKDSMPANRRNINSKAVS